MKLSNRGKGALCITGSAFCFSAMSAFVHLSGDLPVFEKAFFRNFIAAILVAALILVRRVPLRIQKGSRLFVLLRCIFGTVGLIMNFYAIDRLNLADANMLNKLSPFFAVVFSFFLLKERVRPVQALAVGGAFLGSLLIIKPTGANMSLIPALGGFIGGMGAGAAYTCLRRATSSGVNTQLVVLCFSCFSCLFTLPFIAADFVMPAPGQLLLLILCGVFGAGGQFLITAAYTFAPAREISVFDYFQVIFGAAFGYFLFDQLPDIYSFLGYAVIIAMAVLNFLYNNRIAGNNTTATS